MIETISYNDEAEKMVGLFTNIVKKIIAEPDRLVNLII